MKERIESLVTALERDPHDTEIISQIEEMITGEDVGEDADAIREVLAQGAERMQRAGRFRNAMALLETALALVQRPEDEAALLVHQAQILDQELFDQETAIEKLRRAAELQPDNEEIADQLALMEGEKARYRDMVATFKEQANGASDAALKAHMLCSAAERLFKNEPDNPEIDSLLREALDADPSHQKTARLLERRYEDAQDWESLAAFYQRLGRERKSKYERVQMLLAAGYTFAERLHRPDDAAACYAEVLDYHPGHPAALKFLVKYYEEREDWDHLVAVYEDTLHGKLDPQEEMAACMQVGMVHWRYRNDLDEAERYFKRLARLSPAHPSVLEFYRAFAAEKGDRLTLLRVLENAKRATDDPQLREVLVKEVAELSADAANVDKTIDAWKQVLRTEPDNAQAIAELKKLYRQAGKWNNLIDLLRSELDAIDDVAAKVAKYEEMAAVYRDELSLDMMVIKMYQAIIKIDPGNTRALDALIAAFESANRWPDVIKTLRMRADAAENPEERIAFLKRIASLWVERFNNFNKAVEPLEEILELDPGDVDAIATLKEIYEKRRAWKPLMALLEKELVHQDAAGQAEVLRTMARLAAERLNDLPRAIELWWELFSRDESNDEILDTLEHLTERAKAWDDLVRVLEKRESRVEGDAKIACLTKLGTVYKERLKNPQAAAAAWERLLAVQPGNPKAMRSLKDAYMEANDWDAIERLYAEAGDYEALVEVLGIAADRAKDPQVRIDLSFRCARIYNEIIQEPDRAERHYERVLKVDPTNVEAASALVPIYTRAEKWTRLVGVLEIVLGATEEPDERRALLVQLHEIAAEKLSNRETAFEWARRAVAEFPTDATLRATAEKAAEAAHAFDRLLDTYKQHLDAFPDEERTAMEYHIARLSLEKLGNVDDAIARYQEVLAHNPGDEDALLALDAIYRSTGRWKDLESVYESRIALAEDPKKKRDLMMELAAVYEDALDDVVRATAKYRAVLDMTGYDGQALAALERIFTSQEQWADLVGVVEIQKDACEVGSTAWREKALQLAEVLLAIEDAGRARIVFQELLDTLGADADIVAHMDVLLRNEAEQVATARLLEPYVEELGDWRRLAWVLSIQIEAATDGSTKVGLKKRLAEVYAEHLDDAQLALDTLLSALPEDPNDTELWQLAERAARAVGGIDTLAQRLHALFDDDQLYDSNRLALAKLLTRLYEEDLGRASSAEPLHRYILSEQPDAVESFNALEQYYTAAEQWDNLLQLYRDCKDKDAYTGGPLELLLKMCFVLYEVQHDVPASIAAYKEVLDLDPQNEEAHRALATLYEESDQFEALTELLLSQLAVAQGDEATAIRFRLGEIAYKRLGQYAEALDYFESVLEEDPNHLKTQEALEILLEEPSVRLRAAALLRTTYENQGAAEPLVRVLGILLEDPEKEVHERVDMYVRMAELRDGRLQDSEGAFAALAAALKEDCENESVFGMLSDLAARSGLWRQYVDTLEALADDCGDKDALLGQFLLEAGKARHAHLDDAGGALATYRKALDRCADDVDTCLQAVDALDAICTEQQDFATLADVLERKAELVLDDGDRIAALHRLAAVYEDVLERPDKAIAVFRRIVELDEGDLTALSGLERLLTAQEDWPALVEIKRARAQYETELDTRRDLLLEAARILRDHIGDDQEAIAAFVQVCDDIGPDKEALQALVALYTKQERWNDLRNAQESLLTLSDDPAERADIEAALGDVMREHLHDAHEAVAHYARALEEMPEHARAVAGLEALLDSDAKLEAIALLRPLAQQTGDDDKLLRYTLISAREIEDPAEKSRLFEEAAEICLVAKDTPEQAFDHLCEAVRYGAQSPHLGTLLDRVEGLIEQGHGAQEKLLDVCTAVAVEVMDGDLQVRCYLTAGDLALKVRNDAETAKEHYLRVLDVDAANHKALDALEEIYRTAGEHLELFEVYRQKVNALEDDADKIAVLFKQAALCEEHLDDVSGAVSAYETVLGFDPGNQRAIAELERLYTQEDRWADLVDLLLRRRDEEPDRFVELTHRLGETAFGKMGDIDQAFAYFEEALSADPTYAPTVEFLEKLLSDEAFQGRAADVLEPVYARLGDWNKLIGALEAKLAVTDDAFDRKELMVRIGTVAEEQLGDLDKAFSTFAQLFTEDYQDTEAKERVMRLAAILENWEQVVQVLSTILDDVMEDDPDSIQLAVTAADIYENKLHQMDKAVALYKRALAFNPDDTQSFEAVRRILESTESWNDLLALYRDAVEVSMDVAHQKELLYAMADIHENKRDDKEAAIAVYREVLDRDDRDERAIDALDRLYYTLERFEDLADHFRAQIDMAESAKRRNALRRELAALLEEKLDNREGAVDLYEEALAEIPGDRGSIAQLERMIVNEQVQSRIADILEPIYREQDEWKKLVVILQTQEKYCDDPLDKVAKLREVAALHESRGGNYLLAFRALAQAFLVDPEDRAVFDDLVRLVEATENYEQFAETLAAAVDRVDDDLYKKELLTVLGRTYDTHLDMPRKAIDAYTRVLELDETDLAALEALEGLYNLVGDWESLVAVLGKKAEILPDPQQQSEAYRARAAIQEELLGDTDGAIASYLASIEVEPTCEPALIALERLYEATEKWQELVEVKRQRYDLSTDATLRQNLAAAMAQLFETKLDDTFEAITAWNTVREYDPDNAEALSHLEALYAAEGQHHELVEVLTVRRDTCGDQAMWVDMTMRIGDVYRTELGDLEAAVQAYQDVLAQHPTHKEALERLTALLDEDAVQPTVIAILEPLHREADRHDALIAVLRRKRDASADPEERAAIALDIAGVYEQGLGDMKSAFAVVEEAFGETPDNGELRDALERIAAAEEMWAPLCAVYEKVRNDIYDPDIAKTVMLRIGEIKESLLGDIPGAIAAYRELYDNGDASPELLAALERLYEREQAWNELDEILEQEIAQATDQDTIARCKLRQGFIRQTKFEDYAGAIAAYRDVLEMDPENTEARTALEHLLSRRECVFDVADILYPIYESRQEADKITGLIEARLAATDDEMDKVTLLKDLARHHETALGETGAAFDALSKAFALDPRDDAVLADLERLAEASGSWSALVDAIESVVNGDRIDPEDKVRLGLKIAGWAYLQVGDPQKAEKLYRQVLEQDPEHAQALAAMVELLSGLGRFEDLLPVLQKQADACFDYDEKKRILQRGATIAATELGDDERALHFWRQALEIDDSDLAVHDAIIALLEQRQDFAAMVEQLLERAAVTPDPADANRARHQAALLLAGPVGDAQRAEDVYREILDVEPNDGDAAEQLISLLESQKRYEDVRAVLEQQLDQAMDEERRAALLRRIARLSESRLEDYDDAIERWQDVLTMLPEDREAVDALDALFSRTERWSDLVDLLEDQANRAAASSQRDEELRLLVRIGEVAMEQLGDNARATEIFERILEEQPHHTRALGALARLYELQGDYDKTADILRQAAEHGDGGAEEAEIHHRIALLHKDHLDDDEAALAAARKAVSCDPSHRGANEILANDARNRGDYGALVDALMRLEASTADPGEKKALLAEIAQVQFDHLGDPAGATASLEKALALDEGDTDVLLRLSRAYVQANRQQDAIGVLEKLIDAETQGGKRRSKTAAIYHHRLAEAYRSLGNLDAAVEHLEKAYKMDISNVDVLVDLGKLRYEREEWDQAAKLFRALLLQRFDQAGGLTKADIYCYVGNIHLRQGDAKKAESMFRRGLDEDGSHAGCQEGLAACR